MSNYYDFPKEMLNNTSFDVGDVFYIKDIEQRKLYYNEGPDGIDPTVVLDLCRHIMQFNREDAGVPVENRSPIKLYICSNGGDVDAGTQLIDTIMMSETPVHVINTGWCYSMGFLIYIVGHKRFATKNAKFLLHDGSVFSYNSAGKVKDLMEFNKETEDRIRRLVLSKTHISEEQYDSNQRNEWYMYADTAKELGIVDYIIGEDVSIYEVV